MKASRPTNPTLNEIASQMRLIYVVLVKLERSESINGKKQTSGRSLKSSTADIASKTQCVTSILIAKTPIKILLLLLPLLGESAHHTLVKEERFVTSAEEIRTWKLLVYGCFPRNRKNIRKHPLINSSWASSPMDERHFLHTIHSASVR